MNGTLRARPLRLSVGLILFAAVGCEPPPRSTGADPEPRPRASGIAAPALEVGAEFPPLQAEGWVNGEPQAPGAAGVRLLVVDVWGIWCPYCATSAPGLTQVYDKYAARGVAFASITNTHRNVVENFVRRHSIKWPNGYGASAEAIRELGAGTGMPGPPEYEAAPTIYIVGPDRRVLWTDGRGRMKHEKTDDWTRRVDGAIAAALAPPVKK